MVIVYPSSALGAPKEIINPPTRGEGKTVDQSPPIAWIDGHAFTDMPQDLYIPPDALKIFLEAFEGPLDLLLYLIKKQNLDILNIPIAQITHQYQQYIDLMQEMHLELAAEYLLMAAMLAEIKSRLLLPRHSDSEHEDDPRAELVRRLKEYEQFKQAAEQLDNLPRVERDIFIASAQPIDSRPAKVLPSVHLHDVLLALKDVLNRVEWRIPHLIERETLSVRERMAIILQWLESADFMPFYRLLTKTEGRPGVVVALSAILELAKQAAIEVVQAQPYGDIHVRKGG